MSRTDGQRATGTGAEETELAMIPGDRPGVAMRISHRTGMGGCVRLEQMAYSAGMGWYSQKSFEVPAEMLASVITQLRKADCFVDKPAMRGRRAAHGLLRLAE